jgi:hypothetical protein
MNKELIGSLAWAGVIGALALGSAFAQKLGYIDGDTVKRVVIGISGLMIAWYGNRIPKTFAPNASARRAQRVAAWSLVLSGLVYAGLWAFAPIPVAIWGGSGAVVAGMLVTFGYCFSLRAKMKTA